jgi:SpoVK/Ycf46/Vps4 family AAA+-type ATPase
MLDHALFRRFDDVLHYELPTAEEAKHIIDSVVGGYDINFYATDALAEKASLLCQAEIVQVCNDAIKGSLLSDEPITEGILMSFVDERFGIYDTGDKETLVNAS